MGSKAWRQLKAGFAVHDRQFILPLRRTGLDKGEQRIRRGVGGGRN